MASSVLDSLRFSNFLSSDSEVTSSLGHGSTEGRSGVPRYCGDPARFSEWQFRVRTRQLKEKTLSEDELKKLGPLGLRLLDGLSGHALQIAQLMDLDRLSGEKGAQELMEHLQTELRPRREQQARELYEAGAMVGGLLSRQGPETMAQYVLRRRAWYRALTDMSSELRLPDLILSEQLLNNAGLSEDQKLMVRTTLSGKMTFDGVAQELVNQHPRIHERPRYGQRPQYDRGHRPSQWSWQKGKGHHKDRHYRLAFYQDHDYDEQGDGDYNDSIYDQAAYHGYMYDDEHEEHQVEPGDFSEENLALLCEQGLDMEDQEACDTAADIIQADAEAYWAKKGAQQKGQKGFKPPPFEISGSFSLDEKRAKLQQLKARTTCRQCGAVGHWSGDAQCPLSKGKDNGPVLLPALLRAALRRDLRAEPHSLEDSQRRATHRLLFHSGARHGRRASLPRLPQPQLQSSTSSRMPPRSSSSSGRCAIRAGHQSRELEHHWTGAGVALQHQRGHRHGNAH